MAKPTSDKISLRHQARQLALQTIYAWVMSGAPIEQIKQDLLDENFFLLEQPNAYDHEYYQNLMKGIVPEARALDEAIAPFLDRDLSQINPVEHAILRIGAYELKTYLEIPYRVILNEGILLAKKFGASDSHKFINGVLDKLAKTFRVSEIKEHASIA